MARVDLKRMILKTATFSVGVAIGYFGYWFLSGNSKPPPWQLAAAFVACFVLLSMLPESFHARLRRPLSKGAVVLAGVLIELEIFRLYLSFRQFP